jgi:hypothetical protein
MLTVLSRIVDPSIAYIILVAAALAVAPAAPPFVASPLVAAPLLLVVAPFHSRSCICGERHRVELQGKGEESLRGHQLLLTEITAMRSSVK